jgi:hypothetical protein
MADKTPVGSFRPPVCPITRLVGGTRNRPRAACARPRLPSEIPRGRANQPAANRPPILANRV